MATATTCTVRYPSHFLEEVSVDHHLQLLQDQVDTEVDEELLVSLEGFRQQPQVALTGDNTVLSCKHNYGFVCDHTLPDSLCHLSKLKQLILLKQLSLGKLTLWQ